MASESSRSTSLSSFSFAAPASAVAPPAEVFFKQQQWCRIQHEPNTRKNIGVSLIWDHGSEYVSIADPEHHAWRCGHCKKDLLVSMRANNTSNARKHLRTAHKIRLDSLLAAKRPNEALSDEEGTSEVGDSPQIRGLVQAVNIDTFRYHLTRWIVECHLPFTVVENDSFQAVLKTLNGSVQAVLAKYGTVRYKRVITVLYQG